MTAPVPGAPPPGKRIDHARRKQIADAFTACGGNIKATARSLNMGRAGVRSSLERSGLYVVRHMKGRPIDPIARMLPRSMRAAVALRLIEDKRPGLIQRRRSDCARLTACEGEWIEVHRGAETNARCPVRSPSFKRRMT